MTSITRWQVPHIRVTYHDTMQALVLAVCNDYEDYHHATHPLMQTQTTTVHCIFVQSFWGRDYWLQRASLVDDRRIYEHYGARGGCIHLTV